MNSHSRIAGNLASLAALATMSLAAQARSADGVVEVKKPQAIRVIQDRHTGMRWILERTPENPGGPGRLVLLTDKAPETSETTTSAKDSLQSEPAPKPLIRAGDRLVVEEHSAVVDARLEGTALGPAIKGATFNVRLAIGGHVVRAIAVGMGYATIVPREGF